MTDDLPEHSMHSALLAFLSQTAPDASPAQGPSALLNLVTPFVIVIAIFYLLMWRPQAKERKKLQQWLANMKRGDEVVTQSGIIGVVHQVEDRTVTLDVGGGTKLRMLKAQVSGPFKPAEAAGSTKAEARK
jgi:preprotein translocase subunit YajC